MRYYFRSTYVMRNYLKKNDCVFDFKNDFDLDIETCNEIHLIIKKKFKKQKYKTSILDYIFYNLIRNKNIFSGINEIKEDNYGHLLYSIDSKYENLFYDPFFLAINNRLNKKGYDQTFKNIIKKIELNLNNCFEKDIKPLKYHKMYER